MELYSSQSVKNDGSTSNLTANEYVFPTETFLVINISKIYKFMELAEPSQTAHYKKKMADLACATPITNHVHQFKAVEIGWLALNNYK